jgi:hypothetical protein
MRRREFITLFGGASDLHRAFPVGDDILRAVIDWVNYLRQEKLWGVDDPLFPVTKIVVGASRHFEVSCLDRKHWSSAGPIRKCRWRQPSASS